MSSFVEKIRSVYPVSDHSVRRLLDVAHAVCLERGTLLISEGDVNNKVYLLQEGFTRAYVNREGKDITVWFSYPGEPLLMILGTRVSSRSLVNVEIVEDSTVLIIERTQMEQLFRENLELCNWGRLLADRYLLDLETFFTRDLCVPASERYLRLMKNYPDLLNKVPLKHIASYLMVTPESLSRIRSRIGKARS